MPSGMDNNQEKNKITEYVVKNIDKALENGWIKVYYQPVIRSLTGKLCGAESLARWIDPEVGFLPPDKFIGALEESRQIHKLDCWILRKVCSDISERIHNGLDAIPISVNFSRLDLEATDMLKVLEDAVEEYDIPRDYIHVEITESMIVSDAELMTKMIESFRSTGYEVWMDDFGSGYSSLTLLKDYHFDTLKMDMEFLHSFTDRSKSIITSTVTMAKNIEIKTLAEGVETAEQVQFLKEIGCGRLQGYFYGKPMPIDEFFAHIEEFGIEIEQRQWRHFYDVACFNARHTDEPLAIIEDNGMDFKTLYMNEAYQKQVFEKPLDLEEADHIVFHTGSPVVKKYRDFAKTIEQTKNLETFYYTNNGNILCLKGRELIENAGHHLIKTSIRNISSDANVNKRNSIDFRLKELNHMFETVTQINPSKNTIFPLVGKYQYVKDMAVENTDLRARIQKFKDEFVALADVKKFEAFCNWTTLNSRINASSKGYIENMFRVKQADGNYQWKGISIMMIPGTGENEFLLCTKATPDDTATILKQAKEIFNPDDYGLTPEHTDMYARMWENTIATSHIKFFWKDKNRRFLGASKAFLDFYGFTLDDIYGKDDEDMGWHIDGKIYRDDELDVLSTGAVIANVPGNCIVKGVVHNIMCFKTPIYDGTEIIGLMGYFIDVDEEMSRIDKLYNSKRIDPATGLMNEKSFMDTMIDYSHEYNEFGRNFGLIILRNAKHPRIATDYGEDFANRLLKQMGEEILTITGDSCAVARTIHSDFAMLTHISDKSRLEMITEQLKERLEAIKELDGNMVTIRIQISSRIRSDEDVTDENMYQKVLEGLTN